MTTALVRRPVLIVRVAAIAFLIGLTAAASPARAQNPADEAEALIRQGTDLRHQNQDARALPYFDRAYGLARNPRTAAQLGLVKMALGYCVDAERLLDEALAVPDHPWIARNLGTLTETRALARKNIGEVTVVGTPVGAEVLLNGHVVGKLPLPTPLRLDKGPVEIQIRAPGHVALVRSLKVTAGAHENLWIALSPTVGGAVAAAPRATGTAVPAAKPVAAAPVVAAAPAALAQVTVAPTPVAPPPAPPMPAPAPLAIASPAPPSGSSNDAPSTSPTAPNNSDAPDHPSLLRPLAWTTAAGAAIGLTLGIVETVVATHKTDDFNDHTAPATSATPGALDCATDQLSDACRSLRDARDHARTLAIVGYVSAGVFAATSATLFVLSNRQAAPHTESPTLACAPVAPAPGLTCRLTF